MAHGIDPDLLAAIKFEFEYGYKPDVVLEHLREMGAPVARSHLWAMFKRWREHGQLHKQDLAMPSGRPKILCLYMLQVSSVLFLALY